MYADFHCYNCEYGPVIGIFIDRLTEAMCCCLQTYNALVVMCLLAVIVTSADIRKLWVYVCYLLICCLRLFVVVYKPVIFMVYCLHCLAHTYQLSWPLLLTLGSYRYI